MWNMLRASLKRTCLPRRLRGYSETPLEKRIRELKVQGKSEPLLSPSSPSHPPVKRSIPHVKDVLLVFSGKGGVGKSTIATNLSYQLSLLGKRVGLLDADVYGPSLPKMLGLTQQKAPCTDQNKFLPLVSFGLQVMSMGFLIQEHAPLVWRGFMVMKVIQQLLFQVEWSPLDILVVDMPPGTGDTQLSIGQLLVVSGAIIVSTPQDIALNDAIKGIAMFQKLDVPILGLVQNMSVFQCPTCQTAHHLFGKEGVRTLAAGSKLPLLGDIPLDPRLMQASEAGKPVAFVCPEAEVTKAYHLLGTNVLQALTARQNTTS